MTRHDLNEALLKGALNAIHTIFYICDVIKLNQSFGDNICFEIKPINSSQFPQYLLVLKYTKMAIPLVSPIEMGFLPKSSSKSGSSNNL